MALCPAGGALWPVLSRRAAVLVAAAAAVWAVPLPAGALAWVGRGLVALAVGVAASRLLAPFLPRPTLSTNNRAVLVTGCSSGFGLAAALALDAAGATVVGAVRDPSAPAVQRLLSLASPRMRIVAMDVADDASVAAALPAVREAIGDGVLWAVVNNAGVLGLGESEWVDMEVVKKTFDVNTLGPLRVTRTFLPLLRESKGRVVNMISILCRTSLGGVMPYCMSKYATLALTEAMRHELWRFGISVHSVEPWFYKTPMTEKRKGNMLEAWEKCPDYIKEVYGTDYIDKLQSSSDTLMSMVTFPESKVQIVADTIVDACFSMDPKMRYIPSVFAEILSTIGASVPYLIPIIHQMILPRPGRQKAE